MQKLGKDVYVESSFPGVTVGALITPEGVVCIDTPTNPADARKWQLQLAQVTNQPVRYIINLDHHRDRVLGDAWFDAPVVAHEATHERLHLLPEVFKSGPIETGADADLVPELAGVRVVTPLVTFGEKLSLVVGGQEIRMTHVGGCAPSAIWAELPAQQVVFAGDTVTHGVPPILQEADLDRWVALLESVSKKKFTARHIVPGRGRPVDKDGVKPTLDFLRLVRRKVTALVKAGKPRAEAAALAETLLGDFETPPASREHYLRRLRAGLEHVHDSLTAGSGAR